MAKRRKSIDFEGLVANGEGNGPGGFQAQTANGTAHWKGTGWNQTMDYTPSEVPEGGPWQGGRSNRSGE